MNERTANTLSSTGKSLLDVLSVLQSADLTTAVAEQVAELLFSYSYRRNDVFLQSMSANGSDML